jgi:formate C-acetyltransferase
MNESMPAQTYAGDTVRIPGFAEPFDLALPADLAALREKALALQRGPQHGIPELLLSDARAWAAHTPEEDWLLWRARRCAERLRVLPVDLEPGEGVVGKPRFRPAEAAELPALEAAKGTLASMPPYPGGDAGHFHPDYETLLADGIEGILSHIGRRRRRRACTPEQRVFYDACRMVMEALSLFIQRVGDACVAVAEADPERALAWREQAEVCRTVSIAPPRTFHEAIQLLFLAEMALWFAEDHGLASPGRLDQTLWPFYEADLRAGRTTPRRAFERICCLYIQMNRILWPGSAVAVMVGGRDRQGRNVTNDLTYLCLAARRATRLVYPTVGLAWHADTPPELTDFALRLLATGLGDPAFFNDDLIADGLRDHGVREEDVHNFMNSTCVEIKVVGCSNMWVTAPYFNCPQGLLEVLRGVAAGRLSEPVDFAALQTLVRQELSTRIDKAARDLDAVWQARGERACFPLASCLIRDCLERGQDFDRGGARYNWVENSFVGLANLVDSLLAVKHLVYEAKELTLCGFQAVLEQDFAGHEALRQRIAHSIPRYGNHTPEADDLARQWAEFLIAATEANTVGPHRYVPGFFCWIMHERMGAETPATPDGRHAGWPLADGAGAAQGRETCGPTAAVLSTTSWSHRPVLGGLVQNVKFPLALMAAGQGRSAARGIVETYLRRGGFEIQVNVVGREALLQAQQQPERYPDLLVRVAGYSDYFVHLNRNLQDEVIARTEHVV